MYSIQPDKFLSHSLFDRRRIQHLPQRLLLPRVVQIPSLAEHEYPRAGGRRGSSLNDQEHVECSSSYLVWPCHACDSDHLQEDGRLPRVLPGRGSLQEACNTMLDTRIDKLYADAMKRLGSVTDRLSAAADKATVDVADFNGDT